MIEKVQRFTESLNFRNALKVTIAAAIPVVLSIIFDKFQWGMAVAIGVLLTFPSDISSSLKHKINGISTGAVIVAVSAFLIGVTYPIKWIFYPVFVLLVFFLSMISAYGSRATQVSFCGLLSVSIAFSVIMPVDELLIYCLLMLAGGFFYLLVSVIFYYVNPYRYAELQVAECARLTAKYLKLRGDLWNVDADRGKIIEKQLRLQVELNVIHENIRDTLLRAEASSGSSHQTRKLLIAFVSLLDILELGLSTSFEHGKLHEKFSGYPKLLDAYQNIAYHLAATLKKLSRKLESGSKYKPAHNLFQDLAVFEKSIAEYEEALGSDEAAEGIYMLTTMLQYAAQQVENINVVEKALTMAGFRHDLQGRDRDLEKFITPQYYPLSILLENLSFSSGTFRHSLRLTITILTGFLIGTALPLQNAYWILLTIVVIMRPGYGLTKERSYQRIVGTVTGGLIAFGLLWLIGNAYIIGTLAIISMILGFSFTSINYRVGATFVTMYVVLLFALMSPDIQEVVWYRIIDTIIGALLAFSASYFVWPSWEFLNFPLHLEMALKANVAYLKEIVELYRKKGVAPVSYRLARKNAFIEIGNLMSSFQRMSQEPKSKQKEIRKIYKLAELNHTLLSSLASLGTYIQTHRTTRVSEAFEAVVASVTANLEDAISVLSGELVPETREDVSRQVITLKKLSEQAIASDESDPAELHRKKQEAQLIVEQLLWLTSLSENILRTVRSLRLSDKV